jgi:hypothetical protein
MNNVQEHHSEGSSHPERFTIIVNGRQKVVAEEKLSFDDIVALAFENPPKGPNIVFTVTYRKAEGNKEGTLVEGRTVEVKDGTVFNVTATDKS